MECSCFAGLKTLRERLGGLPRPPDPAESAAKPPAGEERRLLLRLPPWHAVRNATCHAHAVIRQFTFWTTSPRSLFLTFKNGQKVVLKPINALERGAGFIVVKELCEKLGVCHPEVDILADCRELQSAIERFKQPSTDCLSAINWRISNLANHPELVMSHIDGEEFLPQADPQRGHGKPHSRNREEAFRRLHAPGVMEQLGRIMALDVVTNNWDRLPWGVTAWNFERVNLSRGLQWSGRVDNLMLTSDGKIHAIDSEFKSVAFPCESDGLASWDALPLFLGQVREVFSDLHVALRERRLSVTAHAVRTFLLETRQVELSDGALIRLQVAIGEGLDKLWAIGDELETMWEKAEERLGLGQSRPSPADSGAAARKSKWPAAETTLARAVLDLWAETRPSKGAV
eukprot:TRINITY_DN41785_c0_g1_i1.p1 TRINITY_DN41785_c0_g1~~TRINITY_DN41785_c0_g1_i1.p1  ORF type:complete len:401 (+),score=39.07 TRINITY_DN41785_c0_g1_i1:75-1277(+)